MSIKYLFITGGVCSSLGKGLTAASIGTLLEKKGLKIAFLKLDPYINIDPGTMNPFEHGEVFVTDDGAETDLDLGHYTRFTSSRLSKVSNVTSGQIYDAVIRRERRGDYLGSTVQVIPHITDEIKERIRHCAQAEPHTNVVIVEIGGTAGDIESLPFLEAIRQFQNEHRADCLTIHLTYVPFIRAAGELKSKPTQQSVQILRGIGIFPQIILCRTESALPQDLKEKIALFCNVPKEGVIEERDVKHTIYELPLALHREGLDSMICRTLGLPNPPIDLSDWQRLVDAFTQEKEEIQIGFVGKYVLHQDAYKSVFEALTHAAVANGVKLRIKTIEADKVHSPLDLGACDGYLVPGGYGERGWEGKILAVKTAREKKIPFFGICLGMQAMTVEFARNVVGIAEANSGEIAPNSPKQVISLLKDQQGVQNLGGTMRLGSYRCLLEEGTRAHAAYGKTEIYERHRHRFEFNNAFQELLEKAGLVISGTYPEKSLNEIIEHPHHPWMVGVQYHPEFLSKPGKPHPLFRDFIKAVIEHKKKALVVHEYAHANS